MCKRGLVLAISNEVILSAFERYNRERDRYVKLTRLIEDICIQEIRVKRSIRAQISARAKQPSSFEKKLYRFSKDPKKTAWSNVDHVFENMSDLAGARVALYRQSDLEAVVNALTERFVGPGASLDGGKPQILVDRKDKHKPGSVNFYRAVHCQVYLQEADLIGENENLAGLGCEIQICSMMDHVWNEIEHDIGYKPTGKIGEVEEEFLKELGALIRKGDIIIDNLLLANETRVSESFKDLSRSDMELGDEHALSIYLSEMFRIQRVTFDCGSLYQEITRLGLTHSKDLFRILGGSKDTWEKAKREMVSFNTFLRKNNFHQYVLQPRKSSDPALWIILQKMHKDILDRFKAGRGQGRPLRIRSLASRYHEYTSHKARRARKSSNAS